jgi:hypothetical protein
MLAKSRRCENRFAKPQRRRRFLYHSIDERNGLLKRWLAVSSVDDDQVTIRSDCHQDDGTRHARWKTAFIQSFHLAELRRLLSSGQRRSWARDRWARDCLPRLRWSPYRAGREVCPQIFSLEKSHPIPAKGLTLPRLSWGLQGFQVVRDVKHRRIH